MKRPLLACAGAVWLLIIMAAGWEVVRAADAALDTAKIERLTGVKGEINTQEGVFKVSVPRTDLTVTAAGVKMTPPMGLTSWAAFQQIGTQTIVMGDIVLLEDQVNPVMSVALTNGLEVTALHNHFFWDTPKVMFMHIGGMGSADTLAGAVGKVFATVKETSGGKGTVPHAELDPARTSLDPNPIEEILGAKGQMANGVYKVTIGRTTTMHGHEMGNTMGVNTWAAFVGRDDTVQGRPSSWPPLWAIPLAPSGGQWWQ
jgi:hypothetical protein